MKIGIVIQARIGSTRLPGKVLKPLSGASMLARVIERAERAGRSDCLIVAVPYADSDDPVAEEAKAKGSNVVRGSEDDVLARFVQAISRYNLDMVVRLTADNPFIEGSVIDEMIRYVQEGTLDYLHNTRNSGYPLGTCVEVARADALLEAFVESDRKADHEHVTPYLYDRDTELRTDVYRRDPSAEDLRLTVDTEEDYQLASWIYNEIDAPLDGFGLEDVLELRNAYPERFRINDSVRQKSITE